MFLFLVPSFLIRQKIDFSCQKVTVEGSYTYLLIKKQISESLTSTIGSRHCIDPPCVKKILVNLFRRPTHAKCHLASFKTICN